MRGLITLYSRKGELLIFGEYANKEERRMVMMSWGARYAPIGYYFIIKPFLEEDYNKNRPAYVPTSRVIKKDKVLVLDKPTEVIRPPAVYDNKSVYGIADDLHKDVDKKIKSPYKKKRRRFLKNYDK